MTPLRSLRSKLGFDEEAVVPVNTLLRSASPKRGWLASTEWILRLNIRIGAD